MAPRFRGRHERAYLLVLMVAIVVRVVVFLAGHRAAIGPRQQVADAGLVGPVLPGAPGFGRIRAVALVAGVDLAFGEVLDLAPEHLRPHQRTRVAWQINRHAPD